MVLEKLEPVVLERADIAAHAQMERFVVVLCRAQIAPDSDGGVQLLVYFADERLFRSLACVNLAAGEFPPALVVAVTTLRRQHHAVTHDDCSYNLYSLQARLPFRVHLSHFARHLRLQPLYKREDVFRDAVDNCEDRVYQQNGLPLRN